MATRYKATGIQQNPSVGYFQAANKALHIMHGLASLAIEFTSHLQRSLKIPSAKMRPRAQTTEYSLLVIHVQQSSTHKHLHID